MKNITLPLPEDVFERIEAEAESKLVKPMHLVRIAVLEKYGSGVSAVPENFTNHGLNAEKVQEKAS